MTRKEQPSQTYILRCWREGKTEIIGDTEWRFSLERLDGEEKRRGFVSLQRLSQFLAHRIDRVEGEDKGDRGISEQD